MTNAKLLTGNLTYLMALEANGLEGPAGELVDKIAAALSRNPPPRDACAAPIALPDEERGRSAYDLGRLDRINARLARGYKPIRGKTAEEQREEDLRRRAELEREIAARSEERQRLQAQAETERLAAARGEVVEIERNSVKRIVDRDPLLSLARTGKLTPEQLETGQEVRDLYDRRADDAGAMEYTGMPRGSHDHEKFVAKRYQRAKACEVVGRIEREVAVRLSAEPAGLSALRWVCERGNSLSSLTGDDGKKQKGRAFERNAAALARALDVADDVLRRRL